MASRGGKREGAGRPKGRSNVATLEHKATIEELARAHAPDAIKALVKIAKTGASESARVAAASSLLDRAYGKPRQAVEHSGGVEVTGGVDMPRRPETYEEWMTRRGGELAAMVTTAGSTASSH